MKEIQELIDAGAVELTPRQWYVRMVTLHQGDDFMRNYAVAVQTMWQMSIVAHGNVRCLWIHDQDVQLEKLDLGDNFREVREFPSTTIDYAVNPNEYDGIQFTPGELRLKSWDRGFACLHVQPVADGGPPSDYFVFFVEGTES